MKEKFAVVFTLSVLLGLTSATQAAIWHVDSATGDDSATGSATSPLATLDRAMTAATGGDTIVLHGGSYDTVRWPKTKPLTDIYKDWVTIEAAPNTSPKIESVRLGARAGTYFKENRRGAYNAYLRFKGIHFADGVSVYGGENFEVIDCRIERRGPWVGSEEAIEKFAVLLNTTFAVVENCEITRTAGGLMLSGGKIRASGNHIHDITHDGIRCVSLHDGLIENNLIHGLDDGVDDGDPRGAGWNRHCDAIHIFIPGPGVPGAENRNLVFRGNTMYDCESQGVQFNNYFRVHDLHNTNITFENNIFGPTRANVVNVADVVDGFIFRHNTYVVFPEGRTYGRIVAKNSTLRVNPDCTDVQIYNNILGSSGIVPHDDWQVSHNLFQIPTGQQPVGRFDLLAVDPQLADPGAFDGRLKATSPAIDAGTRQSTDPPPQSTDKYGTPRDKRPDLGAVEFPGRNPAPEPESPLIVGPIYHWADDFADGDWSRIDPWLAGHGRLGLAWKYLGTPDEGNTYAIVASQGSNLLNSPQREGTAMLVSQQGADWADYSFSFTAYNAYQTDGAGPIFLVAGEHDFYWLDIGRDAGRLLRVTADPEGGEKITELKTSDQIRLPHTGPRKYRIAVRHTTDAIIIKVDADRDGTTELTYSDTDPQAVAKFKQGRVGFRRSYSRAHHRVNYDDITVDVINHN